MDVDNYSRSSLFLPTAINVVIECWLFSLFSNLSLWCHFDGKLLAKRGESIYESAITFHCFTHRWKRPLITYAAFRLLWTKYSFKLSKNNPQKSNFPFTWHPTTLRYSFTSQCANNFRHLNFYYGSSCGANAFLNECFEWLNKSVIGWVIKKLKTKFFCSTFFMSKRIVFFRETEEVWMTQTTFWVRINIYH